MSRLPLSRLLAGLLAVAACLPNLGAAVRLERVPDGGRQPRVVTDAAGTLHLISLGGDPAAADIFYRHRAAGAGEWSAPVRVNSEPGTAIAVGTVRGPSLALGAGGVLHVAWNGSSRTGAVDGEGVPLWYARLDPVAGRFEPQRNLRGNTRHLDGGAAVAADVRGRVWVVWHAAGPTAEGEDNRRVFVAESTDAGRTFAAAQPRSSAGLGACGCCGLQAGVGADGSLAILFRAAGAKENRDIVLLRDSGGRATEKTLDPWKSTQCPMSTAAIATSGSRTWLAWEKTGQIRLARWREDGSTGEPVVPGETARRRLPAVAVDAAGGLVAAWTEGTGWQRGGRVAWERFDREGRPTGEHGGADGVPVWGSVAVSAGADGDFTVWY